MGDLMRLLQVLNLTAGISCLIVSLNILIYGPIMLLEPNIYIVVAEVLLASVTIALNVKVILDQIKEKGVHLWIKKSF